MSVTVIPLVNGGLAAPVEHATGTMVDVDFDHLYVYSQPDIAVATYAKGQWLSAVVS